MEYPGKVGLYLVILSVNQEIRKGSILKNLIHQLGCTPEISPLRTFQFSAPAADGGRLQIQ